MADPILKRIVPLLATVPGVAAIALGGSRARGTASEASDYDIGLYFSAVHPIETNRLSQVARTLVDAPGVAEVTSIGGWGPWIVGGGWLTVDSHKVDLLYRNLDDVQHVIDACRAGEITMHYQPGHPHGFCSSIWMGEIALCRLLHDEGGVLAALKAKTTPYPSPLRESLIRQFQWEVLFAIENAEIAAARSEQTHIAGCAYRALACLAQVLFALNERYLINEKGALQEATAFARTLPDLNGRIARIWHAIGDERFDTALSILRDLERELRALA
jgi:predicted nucleotidyltransferase